MEAIDMSVEEMEFTVELNQMSEESRRFDDIIGTIEEIIMSDTFQEIQHGFMEKYYLEFEDTEENKFIYTDIFQEYSSIIEKYLESELKQRIPWFSMSKFSSSLNSHKDEITEDIFEMFLTFTDFLAFKEMFLDYRSEKEGRNIDLSQNFVVHSLVPACTVTSS
uniref:ADP-ribosylation factor-like protein 2-binding protein n=1 Tax=Phallusia mammillata TaxID=59560 RepID=A0A6F9D7K6_9ASCI|nr:ADP-ribosylation factor-like protein 2-binding protein [Phallusia mammillata]